MTAPAGRKGFTLVELLVVTGLLVSLFALVAGGLGRPAVGTVVRRASQDLASRLLSAQSRALGKPEGSALIVTPDSTNPRLGVVILDAAAQPLIAVDADKLPPPAPSEAAMPPTDAALPYAPLYLGAGADPEVRESAYKVRFSPEVGGPITCDQSPWFAYASGTVTFRTAAGQTVGNTVWPKTKAQARRAIVARYPIAGLPGPPIAKEVAIDLRHSGVGEDPAAPHGYGRFEGLASIAVAYEQVGRVGEIMRRVLEAATRSVTDQPIAPNAPIYFLFAPRSDILEGRNTLANAQSVWVAVNPHTGRVTVAENVPQSAEDKNALTAARQKAREGTAIK